MKLRPLFVLAGALLSTASLHCVGDDPAPAALPSVDGGGDSGAITFCSTAGSAFCADFDRGPTPGADFDGIEATGGGSLALVDATWTSMPKFVRTTFPASTTAPASAQLLKRFPLSGQKKVVIGLEMRVGDTKPEGDQLVRYLALLVDGGSIGLFRNAQRWFLTVHRDNGGPDENEEPAIADGVPLDTWIHVELEVVFGRPPESGSVRLKIGGKDRLVQAIATHGDAQPLTTGSLVLGLSRVAGTVPPVALDFDDVTVRLSP